ncbi:MAG TPA: tRNA uridine-5-carboxymethylaminomethyl(34) synthesis GTPase MnmE, partial [Clostridiales bacterium]|nr:tRNA uridine-5-carboxymethylaminomethyl(34) synthesis GTPase MnmE [Clostridiales bacterium]
EKGIIANERQKNCIVQAEKLVWDSINALENGELLDAITVILDEAAGYLLELTGEKVSETVVDEVFSRFCIGK